MYRIIIALFTLFILMNLLSPTNHADPPAWSVDILESNTEQITIALTINDYQLDTVFHDGQSYTSVQVNDWHSYWGTEGQPRLPMYHTTLGMAYLGTPDIEILESESHTVRDVSIMPNPHFILDTSTGMPLIIEQFTVPQKVADSSATYPSFLAESTDIGLIRNQPIFQLRLYPFQYNPNKQHLEVYEYLKIRVTFPTAENGTSYHKTENRSPRFENVMKHTVDNYADLDVVHRSDSSIKDSFDRKSEFFRSNDNNNTLLKLIVEETGFYIVTRNNLETALNREGITDFLSGDPDNLELYYQDTPVPIFMYGQTADDFSGFYFYNQAIESNYTNENIYWLHYNNTPAIRMSEISSPPTTNPIPSAFTNTLHSEDDHYYVQTVGNGTENDHWYWEKMWASNSVPMTKTMTFDLENVATTGSNGNIKVMLQSKNFSGNHVSRIYLNGTFIDEQTWHGRDEKLHNISVLHSLFVDGQNTLQIEYSLSSASDSTQYTYLNWFDVTYQDTYHAEDNILQFSVPSSGTHTINIDGFSGDKIRIFDITDPLSPTQLIDLEYQTVPCNTICFDMTADENRQFLAMSVLNPSKATMLASSKIIADEPSSWKSPANGASYIIITHPTFSDTLKTLADYRTEHGETVVIVQTTDIYDEFNHGIVSDMAIKDFLIYAYENWLPQPEYVLLVGDSSLDPKEHHLGASLPDLLPTHYQDTDKLGQTPIDNWYAKVSGNDNYPDLFLGRIPVRTTNEMQIVIDKIIAYEQSSPSGQWFKRAIFVADDDDNSFSPDMDILANMLPSHMMPIKIYDYDYAHEVETEMNTGGLLMAYSGHGTDANWGRWNNNYDILRQSNIANISQGGQLNQQGRLPFVTVANCLNGFFVDSNYSEELLPIRYHDGSRSMAEEFLLIPDDGGIAVWAPSSLGYPTVNTLVAGELYKAILTDETAILGQAVMIGQLNAITDEPNYTPLIEAFTYFGDPALELNLPPTLEITAQAMPDPVTIGESLNYKIDYTIGYGPKAHDLTLNNIWANDLVYYSDTEAACSQNGMLCEFGIMPKGSHTLTITMQTDEPIAHNQSLAYQATLTDTTETSDIIQLNTIAVDKPIYGLTIVANPSQIELGESVSFMATVVRGTNVEYTWTITDGNTSHTFIATSLVYTYQYTGTHAMHVTAINGNSTETATSQVEVGDIPPQADCTSTSPDLFGATTRFDASGSIGTNLVYTWNFGDNTSENTTTQSTINHKYTTVGDFTAILTVTNSMGNDTTTCLVEIRSSPTANFIMNSPVELGQTMIFTNTSTLGGVSEGNTTYLWNFGDGITNTMKNPTHVYQNIGSYNVTLAVNNGVAVDTETQTANVTNIPPAGLHVENSSPIPLGSTTYFSATVDMGSNIVYTWDFGNGSPSVNGQNVQNTFGEVGIYTVTVTAENNQGQIQDITIVIIEDRPPIARFDCPTINQNTRTINCDSSASEGSNLIYIWNFADDTEPITTTMPTVEHVYDSLGCYDVILTAMNSQGNDSTMQEICLITAPTANFSSTSPVDEFYRQIDFTDTSNFGGDADGVTCDWQFGDGQSEVLNPPCHTSHDYDWGTYHVSLTVCNSVPPCHTFTDTVKVTAVPIPNVKLEVTTPVLVNTSVEHTAIITQGTRISHTWGFDDGSDIVSTYNTPTVNHAYTNIGTYHPSVIAWNDASSVSDNATIEVLTCPTPSFGSSSPDELGQTTVFTNTSDNGGESENNIDYTWYYNNQISYDKHISYTYPTTGTHVVTLTVRNRLCEQTITDTVEINDVPITGLHIWHDSPQELGTAINLWADSDNGTNIHYAWDLGDGTTATGKTVSNIYDDVMTYTIIVTAWNSSNLMTDAQVVTVTDIPPMLKCVTSSPDKINQTTLFDCQFTEGSNLMFTYDFGDGNITTTTAMTITHVYTQVNNYNTTITSTNSADFDTITPTIAITSGTFLPIACFESSSPDELESTTQFINCSSDGAETGLITYTWSFGDDEFNSEMHPSHTYSETGVYTVVLRIENSVGYDTFTDTVEITDQPIEIELTNSSPTVVNQPTTFTITVKSGTNITYTWDFGDGTPPQPLPFGGEGHTTPPITHVYSHVGDYVVTVTATNSITSVVISDVISIIDEKISGLVISNDSPKRIDDDVRFDSETSTGTNIEYSWRFGDGNTSTRSPQTFANLQNPTHAYTQSGIYQVDLMACNSRGCVEATDVVTIHADYPIMTPTLIAPDSIPVGESTMFTVTVISGTGIIYDWDFGDGYTETTTIAHQLYAYEQAGMYDIIVMLTNDWGSETVSHTIEVYSLAPPDVEIIYEEQVTIHRPNIFTANVLSGDDIDFLWNFGDGYTDTSKIVNHAFRKVGLYRVLLHATNDDGKDSEIGEVNVGDIPIEGLTMACTDSAMLGDTISCQANVVTGTNVYYQWDMGDENIYYGKGKSFITHTYTSVTDFSGDYVSLIVTNSTSTADDYTQVNINPHPIKLTLTHDLPITVNMPITFTLISSSNGLTVATSPVQTIPIFYQIDFGDEKQTIITPSELITHAYEQVGKYIAQVDAVAGIGTIALGFYTTTDTVNVNDISLVCSPNLDIISHETSFVGKSVSFSNTFDMDESTTYFWDFGDGFSSTRAYPVHTYTTASTYTIMLIVTQEGCSSVQAQTNIMINDESIEGVTFWNSSPTLLGKATEFTFTITSGTNITGTLNYGDGKIDELNTVKISGETNQKTHFYTPTKTYIATLTLNNSAGEFMITSTVVITDTTMPTPTPIPTLTPIPSPVSTVYLPIILKGVQ